ncbi:MAG TPA: phosphoribosylamine--glycine ligase [Gemmatimonadota bacterium]|nr:phosphoribosylamine--glycine ligase [Gemmatimonadota bacterium]
MRILIVGNGGREHAFVWKLHRDHPEHDYLITKGNGGTSSLARAVDVSPTDVDALVGLAEREAIDFTVVGPEAPLAAGIVDAFRAGGQRIFGPTRSAARLESSKAFAKELMDDLGIPTAAFQVFRDRAAAAHYAAEIGPPCVVKASGLAAGKGALVCTTGDEVRDALGACFERREFGTAGDEVVIEEFLEGEELSMIALTDGRTLVPLLPSQDHKRALDGDRGPNTGGMGACAPVSLLDDAFREHVLDEIFRPLLGGLAERGEAYTGCLYAGLILTSDGPKVLEWNARFGDPETQAILPLLESDLLELLAACEPGQGLERVEPAWGAGACMTVVAAQVGYPGPYETGAAIELPADLGPSAFDREGVVVFHAGTAREGGRLVTDGGRVLNVTAIGADLEEARERAYAALERIHAPTLRWRSDIGGRELARTRV